MQQSESPVNGAPLAPAGGLLRGCCCSCKSPCCPSLKFAPAKAVACAVKASICNCPLFAADAGQRPSRLGTQQESASAQLAEAAPPEHQPQPPQQQQPEQQHMVWMDDDGSVDALPWDVGSWDVNSGEVSPAGGAAGGGSVPPPPAQAASPGEPVGQDVLISALNRRVSGPAAALGFQTGDLVGFGFGQY